MKQDELARPRLLGIKIHRLLTTTVAAWLLESAARERRGLRTLADRALSASGRMLERAVFGGCLLVPPKALTIVGTFNFAEGSIALTGPQSERAVADWLGTPQLDQGELRESGSVFAGHELMSTSSAPLARSRRL